MAESVSSKNQPEKLVQQRYLLTFEYIQNDNSPKEYLSTLQGKGVSFDAKAIKQKKGNYPFRDLNNVFEIVVIGEYSSSMDMEKHILNSWCTWAKSNENFGWISVTPQRVSYLDKVKQVTKIKDANFCVGGFESPTQFCQHFPEVGVLPCSIVFEYDTGSLSISFSSTGKSSYRLELPSKTFINSAVINARGQELSICIETDERFKISILNGDNIFARTNVIPVSNETNSHKHFGLSSVFQLTVSDDKIEVVLEIIAYLKRKDVKVVYANTRPSYNCYSLNELNCIVYFNDFETEYAWQCLLHRGYKVIDSIDTSVIEILEQCRNSDLAEVFFEMESVVDNNIFFDFEHNFEKAMKQKEDRNEDHESRLEGVDVRRIVVTPTSEIYFKKEPTKQNRVILQYNVDYFLRVVFRDEDFRKLQLLSKEPEVGSIIVRVKNFLRDGIRIGDRHFEFLGCSNSQMREHGAWFVAKHDGYTAESIRKSLGDFTKERCVASFVSRLGLCFSSSWKTVLVESHEMINDVENKDYCFTDGIGKMSESLAKKISTALNISQPSAFQIRYAGCKGVIALDPELGVEEQLLIRDSMLKFQSPSKTLEILQWTKPGQLFLNRQVIALMSGLNVPDEAFLFLQQNVLTDLATILIDEDRALEELSSVLKNLHYKCCRKNGVMLTMDPFFRSILITIYKFRVDGILKKTRIPVPLSKGRIMMGTVDETETLNYGEVFISYSDKDEFSKNKTVVQTGTVVVAKNPCFHPGDLRKFIAVDIPNLHHMVDCIVFPQKGHRPHPDEMSGSDLDGDMYFVCWDQSFIPPNKNETPMDFPKADKKTLNREVRVEDVVEFLGDYIKNDRLGVIANAHVVHADRDSIYSSKCLQLAKMHSDAVDFPKTGKIPEMSKELIVEKYPDFMMKKDKAMYKSKKILGRLFWQCEFIAKTIDRSKHSELIIESAKENPDFLQPGYQKYSQEAKIVLKQYSKKISDLMSQYGIKTEAELFTGMLLSMKTQRGCLENERFEIAELMQRKLSKICKDTRIEFFKEFGGEKNAKGHLESVYTKASAWYGASYGSKSRSQRFLSFPWLVGEYVVSKSRQDETKSSVLSGYTEIGCTVEKHVNQRLSKRMDLLDDIIRYIKYISTRNPNILKLPLVGVVPLCLLNDGLKTIQFYTGSSPTMDTAKSTQQRYQTKYISDDDILRKTEFIKCFLEQDSKAFYLLSYLLDWTRERKLVKDELDFIYISARILSSNKDQMQDTSNLSVLGLKCFEEVRLSKKDQYALGRETIRFFKEYLNTITRQNADFNSPSIKDVLDAFLDLCLYSSLESLENADIEEMSFPLPFDIWNHLYSGIEYVAQKMKEETNLPYLEIRMSKDGLLILHAIGTYEKLKHLQILLEKTGRNHSNFITTPTRDMVVIRNSFIFAFEGCTGKGNMLEYIPYKGSCNLHHKTFELTTPSLQRWASILEVIDCELFAESCLKQIELARQNYDELFHGDIAMNIVLGRFYLINARRKPTSISTFEKQILQQTAENDTLMKSQKLNRRKGRKLQKNQKHFMRKSFTPLDYDVKKTLKILKVNGYELHSHKKSYKVRLNFDEPVFGKYRQCILSLDENLELKNVTLDSLGWVVADVIREKSKSQSLADIRFKLNSKRKLNIESVRKEDALYELLENKSQILSKMSDDQIIITKHFAHRISFLQEKTEYLCCVPGQKSRNINICVSECVNHTNLEKENGRKFKNVEKSNEISMFPLPLPDLSSHDEWDSLFTNVWKFSFDLSNILDSM